MKKYLEILKKVNLFKGIEESNLLSLMSCLSGKLMHYEKNQTVFMSGETINSFGIVLSGQVQIVQEDYYGNRSILANIGVGNLFAESFACAQIEMLPVSVIATTESELLFIDCRKIANPCATACSFHSQLIQNLLHITAMKNISLTQKIEFISKRTTREKLIAYLSAEAQKAGSNCFCIPFSRQELADYLSVDRSAMSAELSKLRNEGILKYKKNNFELL
ncbi:Crp/Fnr family transcriptional regulator [Acetivibrio mesophilus]|uniref:Crp/Fnr family transcriptional regulator n=1 Tax=Acetivibrio mesophilus TaxID=2487273 RepID=A0A4Q0I480_9FIRM|nr:Crp/Fnr family transcriptional regulator [Acetivibrio mesophilus]ODM26127.1 Crp/Fnr family transcriptional regulator [Clostridium sp. Bc-iso-3]RXE59094.1 Crp/Fnr family transcriptional regulator [Acetivibrio mesophilus]HHV29500.1 Crp/Fnr family transcriptional regulator [Clostridium sp.]